MKIREEIIDALGGKKVALTDLTLDKEVLYSDSPFRNALDIKLTDADKKVKCYECKNININWCWNCEKAHCQKHSRGIFVYPLVLTMCLECAKELEKIMIQQIKNKFKDLNK